MGGAFVYSTKAIEAAYVVGKTIAENGCTLITGATTGIPYAAVLGAKHNNGLTVGISPAINAKEHVKKYKKPLDNLDAIVYTGMGYNGREPINIATCDGVVYIGGEFGTLIEFGMGFYDGIILGVLTGVGGISEKIKEITKLMSSNYGSKIIYDSDPERLVDKVVTAVNAKNNSAKHIAEVGYDSGKDIRKILKPFLQK